MNNSLAYFNGHWIPSRDLSIPIDDLGFLLGTTVVERLRTFAGELFRAEAHIDRLRRSLEIVGWDAQRLSAEVAAAMGEFMDRNGSLIDAADDWSVVVFVTPGKTADAADPTVCVHGHPLPFQRWAHQFETGVDAVIVDVCQVPNACWPAELKCRSRIHLYLADQQATTTQPGAQALLLDQSGHVAEATTANVIAYFADRGLVSPRVENILPGISQEVLFELADSLGIDHVEDDLRPEQLAATDELFLASTSICVVPVVRVDGGPIGSGKPGPVFQKLLAAWSKLVGVDIAGQARRLCARS